MTAPSDLSEPIISWRNLDAAPAVEALIRKRAARLRELAPEMLLCRVSLEMPVPGKRSGRGVDVRIHLDLPGPDLDLARTIRHGNVGQDAVDAINAAFTAMERRLKDHRDVQRAQKIKHHAPILHGEVVELEHELGWGILRADDGREVYLQKDAIASADWDQLALGDRVRFREEEGEKGAYATGVSPASPD